MRINLLSDLLVLVSFDFIYLIECFDSYWFYSHHASEAHSVEKTSELVEAAGNSCCAILFIRPTISRLLGGLRGIRRWRR